MPLDELHNDYAGRGPAAGPGPFAYAGSDRDNNGNSRGWSAGFGVHSGPLGDPSWKFREDLLAAQGHFGGWRDESGRTNVGFEADAAGARMGIERGGALGNYFGADVGAFTANAGAKFNDETASIGAQANIIEGSVSAGTDEHNGRFGLSVGVGLAGRAHYGDADGDGVQELGFGADFGPVSFDVKSELLGHAWNGAKSLGRGIGNAASSAWNSIKSW